MKTDMLIMLRRLAAQVQSIEASLQQPRKIIVERNPQGQITGANIVSK